MTSYRREGGARARSAGRFIGRVRSHLLQALVEEKLSTGLTQQQLSEKLDIRRAALNRQLAGEADLTLSSLAEIAWALNREVHIEFRKPEAERGQNEQAAGSTVVSQPARIFGRANASGATIQGVARADG